MALIMTLFYMIHTLLYLPHNLPVLQAFYPLSSNHLSLTLLSSLSKSRLHGRKNTAFAFLGLITALHIDDSMSSHFPVKLFHFSPWLKILPVCFSVIHQPFDLPPPFNPCVDDWHPLAGVSLTVTNTSVQQCADIAFKLPLAPLGLSGV